MDNKFPQLNLEQCAHDYNSFYESVCMFLKDAESYNVLKYILTEDINSQYRYSNEKRQNTSMIIFLRKNYLTNDKEIFLSFCNEILPNILLYANKGEWEYGRIDVNLRNSFTRIIHLFFDLLINMNNPKVFNLDFYFDKSDRQIKRKLDEVSIKSINFNITSLDGDNKIRYEECVTEFISYKKDNNDKLFNNESLNRLKKVVENTLQNNYTKPGGNYPKISNRKEISNILFDGNNPEFENFIDYVIKNIHHEQGGQPKNFTEKEYVYLWLELNNILYLLNRYKK